MQYGYSILAASLQMVDMQCSTAYCIVSRGIQCITAYCIIIGDICDTAYCIITNGGYTVCYCLLYHLSGGM